MINRLAEHNFVSAPEIKKLSLSFLFGLLAAVTFSFHTQIAQNLIFPEKLGFLFFFIIPFAMIFKLLMKNQITKIDIKLIFLKLILSVGITCLVFAFFYQPILPVRYHELEVFYPPITEGEKANYFKIEKVEIKNNLNIRLPISSLRIQGKYNYVGNDLAFYPESVISYKKQFLGNLVLYPSTTDCPIIVDVKYDGKEQKVDLCEVNPAKGYVFEVSDTGEISKKWTILIELIKGIDFFLLATLIFLLSSFFLKTAALIIGKFKNRKYSTAQCSSELRLLVTGLIIGGIPLATILLTGLTDIYLFWPLIIIICFQFAEYIGLHLSNKSLPILATIIFTIGIIFNIVFSKTFSPYRLPFKDPVRILSNSYNDLVTSKFRGFGYSIEFGYRDVTLGRNLYITSTANQTYDFTGILNDKQAYGLETINTLYEYKIVSSENLEFLLNQKHTRWSDYDGHTIIFIDSSLYSPEESIVLDYINGVFIFYPETVFDRGDK